jgi:4-diphosphocytidyl-2-C-methyl-D-erythritol kinase
MSEEIVSEVATGEAAPQVAASNPETPNRISFPAYAKLNLSLEVLGKRNDGYHDLASVMQTVSLADTIYICPATDLEFDCNLPELVEEGNLVWRAACRLHEMLPAETKRGVSMYLEKAIPVSAGLGGGSSDGATALVALNHFWGMGLSSEQLEDLAAELGSDVPFFVKGGTALVEGRGEKLTPLPAIERCWIVLLYPEIEVPRNKTATLYRNLSRNDYSNGGITRQLVREIKAGNRPSESLLYNSFERVVYDVFPAIDAHRAAMVEAGAEFVRVSGSGPTLYALVENEAEGRRIVANLEKDGYAVFLAETVNPY